MANEMRSFIDDLSDRLSRPELRQKPRATVAVRQHVPPAAPPAKEAAPRQEPSDEQKTWAMEVLRPQMLEAARDLLRKHVWLPSQAIETVALTWPLHAVSRSDDRNLIWSASPRWLVTSDENESGKSTLETLEAMMCGSSFGRLTKLSPPFYAHVVGEMRETIFIDEAKLVVTNHDLQAMLLNGYTPGVKTGVMGGGRGKVIVVSSWGATMFSAKRNFFEDPGDTIRDLTGRCIITKMARPDTFYPDIDERTAALGRLTFQGFATWTGIMRSELLTAYRRLGDELAGTAVSKDAVSNGILRKMQIWRPLLAVAEVLGDEWPERTRSACYELSVNQGLVAEAPRQGDTDVVPSFLDKLREAREELGG